MIFENMQKYYNVKVKLWKKKKKKKNNNKNENLRKKMRDNWKPCSLDVAA